MKKNKLTILSFFLIVLGITFVFAQTGSEEKINLWPEIEPFYTGYLRVSELHEIYYELCGNPQGKSVFVLHGGPGGGSSPYMRRFFNPDKFHVILYDQRGAGKSRPYAEIRQNTTQNLVEDIEQLRKHLKLKEIIIFGGSWGATLGLAYAETYPENVSGLVLRGVFAATKEEIDHFYHGGVRKFFPETYDRLLAPLRAKDKRPLPRIFFELIQSNDPVIREKYIKDWARYEIKISELEVSDKLVNKILEEYNPLAFSLLENYYMANNCFLEEGQLLRDAEKIRDIPIFLINGRYDMICPPVTAYKLHQKLPKSKLIIIEGAGHWMGDTPIENALLKVMREFE